MQETNFNSNPLTGNGEVGEHKWADSNVPNLFMEAPAIIVVHRGPQHVYELSNNKHQQIIGNRNIVGKPVRQAMPELEGTGIYELLDQVYSTGEPFSGKEVLVNIDKGNGKPEEVYFNFVYQPIHNSEGEVNGIFVHGIDVTEQVLARKKIEESNQNIRNLIAQAPVAMCLYKEPDFTVEIVSEKMLQIWGKSLETVLNKPIFEAMPDAKGQGFEDILKKVYSSGESFSANEISINLLRNGKNEKIYVNLLYEPYRETDGTITGIVEIANDVTEQVLSRKQIEESEELFNSFGNNIQNLAWIASGDGNIFWYNKRWLDYTGLTLEEMKGWGWQKVHHPHHVERILKISEKLWITNEPFELTFPLRRYDGEYRWFLTRGVPITDENGKIIRWIGTNTDIDEKVNIENQIKESEERFRSLAQTLPQLVWVTNAQGISEFASARWKEYTGIEPGGEKEWKAMVHPDDYESINAAWMHSITTGNIYRHDVRLKSKTGEYRWHTVVGEPTLDNENNIVKWVGAFTDVHEQKEALEKIRKSEQQFSTLANNIQNLAWIADSEGYIYWYNDTWYNYTGTTLEEMKGWGWEKVHHPDHGKMVVDFVKVAWHVNKPWELTFPLRGSDGKYRRFLTRAFPVTDSEGKITSWIGTNTDIEEQKIQEEKKDEFISIASHEMKTPLTTAKAYLQMLEVSLVESDKDAILYAEKASQSVNRLNELISELLDVSKIRLGKLNYTITTFDFNDMVDSTVENMQITSPNHSIVKAGKVNDEVTGDKHRIQQVIINLLTNAIKYSPNEEKVFITVEQQNEMIKVSVKDSGIGMSKESLKKIFDKYHRIEEHAVHFQGLGIGLFISYEIIQRHNGTLWAVSEQGKGSTFYFTIPVNYVGPVQ